MWLWEKNKLIKWQHVNTAVPLAPSLCPDLYLVWGHQSPLGIHCCLNLSQQGSSASSLLSQSLSIQDPAIHSSSCVSTESDEARRRFIQTSCVFPESGEASQALSWALTLSLKAYEPELQSILWKWGTMDHVCHNDCPMDTLRLSELALKGRWSRKQGQYAQEWGRSNEPSSWKAMNPQWGQMCVYACACVGLCICISACIWTYACV